MLLVAYTLIGLMFNFTIKALLATRLTMVYLLTLMLEAGYYFIFISLNYSNSFPGTSVTEIFSYGIPLSKIVVGKYNLINDASNGFISASLLGVYFSQAYSSFGWKAGVMVWAWQQSSSALWISQSWICILFFVSLKSHKIAPKPVQNITPKIASTTTTSSSKKPSTPTVKDSTTPLPSIITTSSYSDTINRNLFVSNRKVVYIDYRDINWVCLF